jgi:hypothetical protein
MRSFQPSGIQGWELLNVMDAPVWFSSSNASTVNPAGTTIELMLLSGTIMSL